MKRLTIFYLLLTIFSAPAFGQGSQITQAGTAYGIASPYAGEDLFEVQTIQSGDVMYLVHNEYAPQILTHYGDTNWTIEDVNLDRGPFMNENTSKGRTITPSDTTGDITLTAATDTFYPEHVGALWQLAHTVDSNSIKGEFETTYYDRGPDGSADDQYSDTLAVAMGQDFTITTAGFWYGTLYIQRSFDETNWLDVYSFTGNGTLNMDYRDTETVADAEYRLKMTDHRGYNPRGDDKFLDFDYTMVAMNYVKLGIVEITGYANARIVDATVLYDLGGTEPVHQWAEGAFSDYRGYPAAVSLHKERLVFAGTVSEPDTMWFSQTDDWHNFLVSDLDTSAVTFRLAADQANTIRWLCSHKDLMIGTSGDEWQLNTPPGKPFARSTVQRQTTYGSAKIQSLLVNNQVCYVQRNAKKIQRMKFAFETNNWQSTDLTLLSEHITGDGVVEMAYQRTPFSILWSVCENGELLALVLEDNQEILGWSRYVFDGYCESVAVVAGTTEDRVWLIIRREINGETVRYIEELMPIDFEDQDSAFYVDCGLSFDYGDAVEITNITQADPAVVTAPEHTFADGDQVQMTGISGMVEANEIIYTVSTVTGASFELRDSTDAVDIDSTEFTAYASGGTVEQVENTFSTLTHLEAESVVAAGDGGYAGSYTVTSGAITLDDFYNHVHIGRAFTAKLEPMKLDFLSTGGALQGRTKRISKTTVRLFESLSCSIGPTWTDYDSYVFRNASDTMETATPLFSGDKELRFPGGFGTAGDICIQDSKPVPLTVLGLIVDFEAER